MPQTRTRSQRYEAYDSADEPTLVCAATDRIRRARTECAVQPESRRCRSPSSTAPRPQLLALHRRVPGTLARMRPEESHLLPDPGACPVRRSESGCIALL